MSTPNNGHATDPLADLATANCLPLKDRKTEWMNRFNKYLWDEDSTDESAESACRDAKALGLPQNFPIRERKKGGPVSAFAYILEKLKPRHEHFMQAVEALILIRFQDEPNSGRVGAWQDHAGLIHSPLSGRK
jgi:hypothetical protein